VRKIGVLAKDFDRRVTPHCAIEEPTAELTNQRFPWRAFAGSSIQGHFAERSQWAAYVDELARVMAVRKLGWTPRPEGPGGL